MVGCKSSRGDGVIALRTGHPCRLETDADLHPLYRSDTHEGLGKVGVGLVEDRLPQTWWTSPHHDRYDPAEGVPLRARFLKPLRHPLGRFLIGAEEGVFVDLGEGDLFRGNTT